jgi:hypothetical protein
MIRFLLLSLLACSNPVIPISYSQWYAELEVCSGLSGNFTLIQWQQAKMITVADSVFSGYWTPPHRITILSNLLDDEMLVKHEEMHDLLQRGDHPPEYFNGKCGDLIHV